MVGNASRVPKSERGERKLTRERKGKFCKPKAKKKGKFAMNPFCTVDISIRKSIKLPRVCLIKFHLSISNFHNIDTAKFSAQTN